MLVSGATTTVKDIGCDSFDGTKYSRFPDTHIPRALRFLESERRQGALW